MSLYYNTQTNKAYNGNIMYQFWGTPGNLTNHYTYKYDKLNRLLSGVTSADNYQESGIAYDTQGNLTALNRYQAGTQVDQLSYSYSVSGNPTNQLQSVVNGGTGNNNIGIGTTNYTYDVNGNMLTATNTTNTTQNKSFTYNLLNLPSIVTTANGTATYTYDAAGNKLRKVDVLGGVTTNTDYIGGIQYDGAAPDALDFIQTEEGKAVKNGNTYEYIYYLGDNLGNTRVTFGTKNGIAQVYQQDDYYPFGLEILRTSPVPNPKNEYLYNKKELQEEFNEYDYGARFYDPVIGRWNSIDPLAEVSRRWSTYNYVEDDPVRLTDPDGMETDDEKLQREALEWGHQKSAEAAGVAYNEKNEDGGDPRKQDHSAKGDHTRTVSKIPPHYNLSLAQQVMPTENENMNLGVNVSLGYKGLSQKVESAELKSAKKESGPEIISQETIDKRTSIMFIGGGNMITSKYIKVPGNRYIYNSFNNTWVPAPMFLEVQEKIENMTLGPFSMESREVYSGGIRQVYQGRYGIELSKGFELGKKGASVGIEGSAKFSTDWINVTP